MAKKIYEKNGSSHRRLEGKVAIITGAGTGIGEAIAHKFAWEGARVIVNGLPDDPIADVAKAIHLRKDGGSKIKLPILLQSSSILDFLKSLSSAIRPAVRSQRGRCP